MKPSDAHNHIKPFLRDHYAFDSASRVEGFTRIFASISGRNQSWDTNSSQAFLDSIVNGNALLRLGDVLRYSPVATNSGGANRFSLSFQRGYFPVLEYFSSDLILKTTMHHNINALYAAIDNNYDAIQQTIQESMSEMVDSGTWEDTSPGLPDYKQSTLDGVVVFKSLVTLFSQFKSAIKNHPQILALTEDLNEWFTCWSSAVSVTPPAFKDPITSSLANVRELTINQIRQDIDRLVTIVRRESGVAERQRRPAIRSGMTTMQQHQALVTRLHQTYDPPGVLRDGGQPRHNNDHMHISDIRIVPTHEELMCPLPPYLPKNLPDAPHHQPEHSMERHLDIQFRLLREDFISPIRQSLDIIHNDLEIIWNGPARRKRQSTKLEDLIGKGGGAYRSSGMNSVFFHLYVNVSFLPAEASRRTFTIGLQLDAPPGTTRDSSPKKRSEYWEHSKRLQFGSLVALVLVTDQRSQIFLGTIASMGADIAQSAKVNAEAIQIRVTFFDAEVDLLALRREKISVNDKKFAFLVDNNVMFESVKPFLETLQGTEPTSIPFSRYISSGDRLQSVSVLPPRYARVPGFKYKLQCLARPGQVIRPMSVQDPTSIATARRELRQFSDLDASQVEAVVDVLTREASLIQGPPGTGKSYTGKEILRALFASKIRPIVLIAYTNHALDHMLTSILDAKITTNLVRLGSRSADERIAEYNLTKLEQMAGDTDLDRTLRREYGIMKKVEEDMKQVMNSIQLPEISWERLEEFLDIHYPDHAERLKAPPYWISVLFNQVTTDEEEHGEWQTAGEKKKSDNKETIAQSGIYGFWRRGRDMEFIMPPPLQPQLPIQKKDAAPDEINVTVDPRTTFFTALGFGDAIPPIPSSHRPMDSLMDISNVWSISSEERTQLASFWENEIRQMAYISNLEEFEVCRSRYKDACRRYNDVKDESRRRLLSKTDLIGCTTTGAAKLVSLLTENVTGQNIGPKVLMVEEAGQVLEAHILSSLVPSVEHLICIGDPQQLRPTLATFALSMDSESGRQLYKFDRSLMERLADNGMPMSQIDVQRRMRPTISHFPRTILYPKLQDHAVVHEYPPVQGIQKDVYFFTHTNKENGEADSVSKYNKFEVEMIRDLVLYFLKQGPYNGAGDIAVLCAYLGQLQKVRAALRDLRIAVAVDERDEDQLARQGDEDESGFDQVLVTKHIRLGTVDTFQGEEAKIVIVSLVRNSGSFDGSSSIGFLKVNRSPIPLS
ncbi:hypothetical protein EWM64_g1975 [Hericium alpestre]|uniref:AAA+ ATPase domain-containing protein n=1 Tax=Hericium alpestre TaxID=135208 RepID=A0A4Z0A5N5_9AGAM|nr:hypothetical protein EWM64_g1975 [Hericium alpestre]